MNHWAAEPIVTRDVDFVVGVDEIDRAAAKPPDDSWPFYPHILLKKFLSARFSKNREEEKKNLSLLNGGTAAGREFPAENPNARCVRGK